MPGDRHIRAVPTGSSPITQSSAQPVGIARLTPVDKSVPCGTVLGGEC